MDSILPLFSLQNQPFIREAIQRASESVLKSLRTEDYVLLPLLAVGIAFIYNRGSVFPKGKDAHYDKFFEKPQESMGAVLEASTRNVAEKIHETNADVVIFWGSQSGVAEGFASRLAREFQHRFRLSCLVADLSDYDPHTVAEIPKTKTTIFIMSTFGEGDPSDNAADFVSWVSGKGALALSDMRYAAFGCGNKNYRFYNKVIDDVVDAVERLGATTLLSTGRGDEAARTTDEDFIEWKEKLFSILKEQLSLSEHDVGYEEGVVVNQGDSSGDEEIDLASPLVKAGSASKKSPIVTASVVLRREIASYSDKNRSCVHIEVDLSVHRQVKYRTGDHLAVWPSNPSEDVNTLLQLLNLEARKDDPIRITSREGNEIKVPRSTTAEALFKHHLEISAPVPRETVIFLSEFASIQKVKEALREIGKDRHTYATFLEQNYLTLPRLLTYTTIIDSAVSWENLPLSFIIDVLPAMRPRTYSISSSPVIAPRHAHLTISVKPAELLANTETLIPGLTSTHLSKLPAMQLGDNADAPLAKQSQIYVQVRPSTFKLPTNLKVPVIMVAAGTGVAPFRAFIHERAQVAAVGREVGPMLLFFGCQSKDDYLYEDELREHQEGALAGKLDLSPAFSRAGNKKQYVSDAVQSKAHEVGRLLVEEDAAFYICGAATMAKSVRDVVKQAIIDIKGCSDDEAEDLRMERKRSNRWFEDAWS